MGKINEMKGIKKGYREISFQCINWIVLGGNIYMSK
jgi:hypothetical protein